MTSDTLPTTSLPLLRQTLKARRRELDPQLADRGALLMRGRLYAWLNDEQNQRTKENRPPIQTIAGFWPIANEPDLRPLFRKWVLEAGYTLALPTIINDQQPLVFKAWTPDSAMVEAAYGIMEPEGNPVATPDLVLVPTLGYTRQGHRLGYGKGFYDRTLAALRAQTPGIIALGIAWALGDLSATPYQPQAHDQRLDLILTDKGWPMSAH